MRIEQHDVGMFTPHGYSYLLCNWNRSHTTRMTRRGRNRGNNILVLAKSGWLLI